MGMCRSWEISRPGRRNTRPRGRQAGVGRDDVEMVGCDRHAVLSFSDRQRSLLGEDLGKQAVMHGIEVLDHEPGHAGRRREPPQ